MEHQGTDGVCQAPLYTEVRLHNCFAWALILELEMQNSLEQYGSLKFLLVFPPNFEIM